jgi:uncharacterized protein (DUF2336 family)
MSEPAPLQLPPLAEEPFDLGRVQAPAPERPPSRARNALLKRLADVVCLPSSRINAFERSMTADLLVEMLRDADQPERERAARRLVGLTEVPSSLARLLLRDDPAVSRHLLEQCASLHDADLIDCIRRGSTEHRRLVASRRGISEIVSEAVVDQAEPVVIETLLRNDTCRLSNEAVELMVAVSRSEGRLVAMLLRRPELRPRHAYVMFWWADEACRRTILQRFAVSREVLQDAVSDVFPMIAEEGWGDPLARKALQFIERRQRNRAAIDKSPYDSLDEAVLAAGRGMTREIAEEISYLAGLKPMTGAKIFTDPGGEPLAILCKATGLPRINLVLLWRGLRRAETDDAGQISPALERVMRVYDEIAVDRAQTVLRYWNWALSSAMTAALVQAIRDGDEGALDEYSVPQRAAMLALSSDLGR